MFKDPIVEEVRKIRETHAEQFNYDLDAIFNDLKKKEKLSNHKIISRIPKYILKATGT